MINITSINNDPHKFLYDLEFLNETSRSIYCESSAYGDVYRIEKSDQISFPEWIKDRKYLRILSTLRRIFLMNRIASKVALQTLLYTISSMQWIKVVDYPNFWSMSSDSSDNFDKGEIVFDERAIDLIGYKYNQICRSQCKKIVTRSNDMDGRDYLVVCITSSEEEF